MDLFDVKNLIGNAKRSLERPSPHSFEQRSKLYDESHNFLINVGEAKNFLEEDPTVKERYDPKYTLKELEEIESRLRTRLEGLADWLISETLKTFSARDLSLQTLEEAQKLAVELRERFHLMGYHEKAKGTILFKEFLFLFQYAKDKLHTQPLLNPLLHPETILDQDLHQEQNGFVSYPPMEMRYRLKEETYMLLDKFCTRLLELSNIPPVGPKIDKQYLEPPNKAFKETYRDLAMEEERTRGKIREFLSDERVRNLFRSLPPIEVDFKLPMKGVVCNRHFSPDEVMVFVISVLEPKVFYWTSYAERKAKNGETEFLTFERTLSSSSRVVIHKTSKPGPKYIANECIIPLTVLLRKCFKCSEKCTHKHHPSVYQCIADLLNACGMEGKTNWNSNQVKMRYERIKKDTSFNEEWWQKSSADRLAMWSDFHKRTGLFELIQRYVHQKSGYVR